MLAGSGTSNGRIQLRFTSAGGWPVHNGWYTWTLWVPTSAVTVFTPAGSELDVYTSQIDETDIELSVGTFARARVNTQAWSVPTGGVSHGVVLHGTVVEIITWGVERTFVSVTTRNDHGQVVPPALANRSWWVTTGALEIIPTPWVDSSYAEEMG